MVEELEKEELVIGGDIELLNLKFNSFEVKKGKSGKTFIEFNIGEQYSPVRYFPDAKYGRYITRQE